MARLEFFFDYSSPWTYLAFDRIEVVAADTRAELIWKPILVGGVFNTINPSVYQAREAPVVPKARYQNKDLQDWARYQRLRIDWPDVFPVNSVRALRGAFYAEEEGVISDYSRAVFEAYWGDLRDISQEEILREIVLKVGLDVGVFFQKIVETAYKDRLRANTEELMERGGFGSPTLFVNGDDMYFGNDRLHLVQEALSR